MVNKGLKTRNTSNDAEHKLLRCYRAMCNVLSGQNYIIHVWLDVLTPDPPHMYRKLSFFCPHSVYRTYFPFSHPSYCCPFAFFCSVSTVVSQVHYLQLHSYNYQLQPAAEILLTCAVNSHSLPHLLWFDILWAATWLHIPAGFFTLLRLLETIGLI